MRGTATWSSPLLDLLFDEPSVGRCLVAPDGSVLRANSEWLRSTGFDLDDVLGANIVELFPETRDMALAMHARARAGHHVEVPRHAQRLGGRDTWWAGSVDPVPMEGGTGILITAREVTRDGRPAAVPVVEKAREQQVQNTTTGKRAEDDLRDGERLRALGDNLPQGGVYRYQLDANGVARFIYVSAGIERLTGVPVAEILREAGALHRQLLPEDRERLAREERRSRDELAPFQMEVRQRHRETGELRWALLRSVPSRLPSGETVWDGIHVDITDRKLVEVALQRSEERYRALFQNLSEGFALHEMLFDEHGRPCDYRFLEVNAAFERLTGLPREQVVGRTVLEVLPDVEPVWIEKYGEVVRTGRSAKFDHRAATLGRHYEVIAFSPQPGQFAALFLDVTMRKGAEEERQRLSGRLQTVLDTAPIAIWIAEDPACRSITGNAFADALLRAPRHGNVSRSAPPGEAVVAYRVFRNGVELAPEDLPAQLAARTGKAVAEEILQLVFADGREIHLLQSAAPLIAPDGSVSGAVTAAVDITRMVGAQAALRESETRFRSVLKNTAFVPAQVDRDLRYTWIFNQHLDFDAEKVLGKRDDEIEDSEGTRALVAAKRRVLETGIGLRQEISFERSDGTHSYDFALEPMLDGQGAVVGVASAAFDITTRKRAEEALRAREAGLALLSRTAGQLLGAEDPQRVIDALCREVMQHLDCQVFLNFLADSSEDKLRLNAWAGITTAEAQRTEWLGHGGAVAPDGRRTAAEDPRSSGDALADLVRSAGIQAYCCHPLTAQGRILGTLSFGSTSRTRFSDDEIELMRIVADQVATALQRVEAQRALSAANAELVEADRRKNEFLAVLSHELRNPLAPIRNSLYILERAVPGGEQANRAKEVIDRQVAQLARLVDDLLDVTRITRNKVQLQKERLELNEVVCRTVEDYRSVFENARVQLDVALTRDPVAVSADRTRLAQIVGNLLQNAAKFTPSGGHTSVAVALEDRQASVRVADDGVGMTPEMLDRLFEPFAQAAQSLDRSRGGLGLGLALVKGLVELHGGNVSARSEGPGKGTELVVRLPIDGGPPLGREAIRASTTRVRRRVVVIEDNVDAAESLREVLELEGHEVAVAHEGPAGVEMARSFKPDVVLCDIGLPGMDGYGVARALRADAATCACLVIALSGYALPEDSRAATEAGFDQHLPKPVSLARLSEILRAPVVSWGPRR